MTKIYFNNYSTEHLGPIYKDNYIDADGLIVEVDIDLSEVNYMYVNFRVGQLSYTNDVSIVDAENNIVSVPVPTEVLKEGTHQLELVAVMNNGSVIPSRTYKYLVDKSLENPNAVEAESYYPILITLIEEVTDKIDEANDAVERVEASIENMTNELAEYKEATTNELVESFNNYSNNTTSNITNILDNKIAEVDTRLNNKIQEVNELVEEVESSEEARKEEHTQLVNELSSYSNDLNDIKDRVDVLEEEITDNEVIVDLKNKVNALESKVSKNEKDIKNQGVLIDALFDLTETISITEEGTIISLPQSDDGTIIIDELQGNTLVNYCTNGSEELTLNNEINVQGINVTLTNTVDNGKVDVVCEGNTLTNSVYSSSIYNLKGTASISRGFNAVTLRCRPGKLNDIIYYRVNFTLNKLTTNAGNGIGIQTARDAGGYSNHIKNFKDCVIGQSEHVSAIRKIDENCLTLTNSLMLGCNTGVPSDCVSGVEFINFTLHDFVIINLTEVFGSGNEPTQEWCDENLPYFEGMKSAFELEDNKVEIVGQSKNLINNSHLINKENWIKGTYWSYPIKVKPNTTYSYNMLVNCTTPIWVGFFGGAGNYTDIIKTVIWNHFEENKLFSDTFNTGQRDTIYLSFYSSNMENNFDAYVSKYVTNIQLEEGSQATSYVPYSTNTHSIQLSEPLRGLPNGVCDKFVKQGGKWYVERNCREVFFDGDEAFALMVVNADEILSNSYIAFGTSLENSVATNSEKLCNAICDNFSWSGSATVNVKGQYNKAFSIHTNGNLYFKIEKMVAGSVEQFKQWLQNNPTTIVYQLVTPTYEEITDPQLITYLDTTHISTNSTIPCNMEITNSGYNAIIKPSTKYTVAFDTNKSGEVNIGLGGAKTSTTNNVATITTPSTLTDDTLRLYGKGIKASNVRLLEGDKTNYIPSYFEGMKSCFEDKEQDNGSYEVEIISNNKNLLDIDYLENFDNYIKNNSVYSSIPIKLKPNTEYTFSFDKVGTPTTQIVLNIGYGIWEDPEKSYIITSLFNTRTSINSPQKITFNSGNHSTYYLHYYENSHTISNADINQWFTRICSNVQLEESNVKTDYIPHKSNSIQLQLNEPLRAVGDVKDRFVLKDGKLMIERNVGEIVLNGSETWVQQNKGTSSWAYECVDFRDMFVDFNMKNFIFDTIPYSLNSYLMDTNDGWFIDRDKDIWIRIKNAKLSEPTVNGFKMWLSENNVKVNYKKNLTYEEVPCETQKLILECFENGTLFIDTLIPPTVSVTYSANKPITSALNQVQTIQDEQDTMILENSVNIAMMNLTM